MRDKRCAHFYACVGAFASGVELKQEFAPVIKAAQQQQQRPPEGKRQRRLLVFRIRQLLIGSSLEMVFSPSPSSFS